MRRWNAAVARSLGADMDAVMALHGGPVFATSHEPHGNDYDKWRKFVLRYGFRFFATASIESVRHSVYVRER
ncbi:MAG TPA: hypothetical protein VGH84_01465 [Steroidobacteraceae bacterium]